jgi:hypothetical protein
LRIPRDFGVARTNPGDKLRREPIADLRMTPRELVERTEHAEPYRYDSVPGVEPHGKPVLFVPPVAAPAVTRLPDLVTGSPDADLVQARGGHLGVLTGRAARKTTWPDMEEF